MTEVEIRNEEQKDSDLRQQVRRVNAILLVVLAVLIIGPASVTYLIAQQYPSISTISIDNIQVVGPSALCPGDVLTFSYNFHATGAGVLIRDATVRIASPPRTVIFSTSRRFILDGPIDQTVTEAWHVPDTYVEPETDLIVPVPAGRYVRLFAVSSPSRSTVIAIGSVQFEIKGNC